jgi:predicted RNA-binding protein with PUA-like domain
VEYWLFHGNPERWRFFDYIREHGEESLRDFHWSCYRYREAVKPGHKAALWMAGPPKTRGIYALGKIKSEPYETVSESELWTDPADRNRRMWSVDIGFDRLLVKEPILATELRADPRFAEASIIRAPRHANPHRLRRREWQAILQQAKR